MEITERERVTVLGRDEIGVVAEGYGMRYYLTDCCGASAKGTQDGTACRACYQRIDPRLGDVPDRVMVSSADGGWEFVPRDGWKLTDVYGDGMDYDEWKATR